MTKMASSKYIIQINQLFEILLIVYDRNLAKPGEWKYPKIKSKK